MQFFNLITFTGLFLSMCVIVSLSYKVYTLKTLLKQLVLDQRILKAFSETLKDQLDLIKNETDETQEHFIKFLSDSREVAFNYIETSITSINDIILYCEQQIEQPKLADLYSDAKLKFILEKLKVLVESEHGKETK
jgi:hypothetical protein